MYIDNTSLRQVLRDPAMETLKVEPCVRNLRDNPLFKVLLRKMNPPE
jgi:hypothetical protein